MFRAESAPWFKGWEPPLDVDMYNIKNLTDKDRKEAKCRRRIEEIEDARRTQKDQAFLWL